MRTVDPPVVSLRQGEALARRLCNEEFAHLRFATALPSESWDDHRFKDRATPNVTNSITPELWQKMLNLRGAHRVEVRTVEYVPDRKELWSTAPVDYSSAHRRREHVRRQHDRPVPAAGTINRKTLPWETRARTNARREAQAPEADQQLEEMQYWEVKGPTQRIPEDPKQRLIYLQRAAVNQGKGIGQFTWGGRLKSYMR